MLRKRGPGLPLMVLSLGSLVSNILFVAKSYFLVEMGGGCCNMLQNVCHYQERDT